MASVCLPLRNMTATHCLGATMGKEPTDKQEKPKAIGERYDPPAGYLFCGDDADTKCKIGPDPDKKDHLKCEAEKCGDGADCKYYIVRTAPGEPDLVVMAEPGESYIW